MALVINCESKRESEGDSYYLTLPERASYFVSELEHWKAERKIVAVGT